MSTKHKCVLERMVRSGILFAMLLACALLLAGCVTEYDRNDIKDYLKERGIKNYTLAKEYYEVEGEDGYTDKYWDVETTHFGFDHPVKFRVIDNFYWGFKSVSNSLGDDADAVVMEELQKLYTPDGKLQYDGETDSVVGNDFYCPLDARDDFYNALDEVENFQAFLEDYPHILQDFSLCFYAPLAKDGYRQYTDVYLSSYTLVFNSKTSREELLVQLEKTGTEWSSQGLLSRYLDDCLRLGLRDRIEEFREEEIKENIRNNASVPIRTVDEKPLSALLVYGGQLDEKIPYGHLYELAKLQGVPVTGDWYDFTITSPDQLAYHISYQEVAAMDAEPLVTAEEASKMLGIALDDGRPYIDCVITKDVLDKNGMSAEGMKTFLVLQSKRELKMDQLSVVDGELKIHAKERPVYTAIRANEKEMDAIVERLQWQDDMFAYTIERVSRDYEGISIRVGEPDGIINEEQEAIKELIGLAYLNHKLARPGEEASFTVSFYYQVPKGNYETERKTIAELTFPES